MTLGTSRLDLNHHNELFIDEVIYPHEQCCAKVMNEIRWFIAQVTELISTGANSRQVKYILDNIIPRLLNYSQNMTEFQQSRSMPNT